MTVVKMVSLILRKGHLFFQPAIAVYLQLFLYSAQHLLTVVPTFTLLKVFPASANTFLATIPVFANSLGPQLSQLPLAATVVHFRNLLRQHPTYRYKFLDQLIFAYNNPPTK